MSKTNTSPQPDLFGGPVRAPAREKPPPSLIVCGCGSHWTGLSACHATCCHRTFSGISAFDQHRLRGHCCDPESHGLAPISRAHWSGWGYPGDDARWDS
jgi:hypothetical protein